MSIDRHIERARKIVALHRAEYRGRYVMFGGSSGGGSTTTVQKSDPWSGQQPYLQQTMQDAQKLYQNKADYPQYYPNSTVQPFNPMESSAVSDLNQLGTQGNSTINSAGSDLTNFNNGSYLSADNPYFQSMADSVKSQVVPGLESQFAQGNDMNSPAAAYAVSKGTSDAVGNLAYQNYSDQLGNMIKSAALSPTQYQANLTGAGTALGAGQAQQQQDQTQLSDQVNRYTYNQELPYEMLNQYANSINGNYGGTSTLTQPYSSNALSGGISGALSGGMLGNLLFPAAAGGTAFGALGGAGLGALLAFSDRRLKKSIRKVGELIKGIALYEFKYLWGEEKHTGVMADEVAKVRPDAIGNILGFGIVDYGKLGGA